MGRICLVWMLVILMGCSGIHRSATPKSIAHRFASIGVPGITTLNIVAHLDDDILFMNPDIAYDIDAGDTVWVVYLSASQDDTIETPDMTYVSKRIVGVRAAYAVAAGIASPNWTYQVMPFGNKQIATNTLQGTNLHLAFLYIRAANYNDNCGDLFRLLHDRNFTATTVDGSSMYTEAGLTSTLRSMISSLNPAFIRTEDTNGYAQGVTDNIDHTSAAVLATAADTDSSGATIVPRYEYLGYLDQQVNTVPPGYVQDVGMAPNLAASAKQQKTQIWQAYYPNDPALNPPFYTGGGMPWANIMGSVYSTYHVAGSPWDAPTGFANVAPCSSPSPHYPADTNPLIIPIP